MERAVDEILAVTKQGGLESLGSYRYWKRSWNPVPKSSWESAADL